MLTFCSRFSLIGFLILAAVTAVTAAADKGAITGKIRVIDGDTFDVGNTRVRLHGIDALESGQPCTDVAGQSWACGDWTTRQVRDRYQGAAAACTPLDNDRYGRVVARCVVAGQDVGRVLVQEGLAYAFRKYAMDYDLDEKAAFIARRGIHGFSAEAPARYRLSRRSGGDVPSDPDCRIKGNISQKGDRIYHMPGQAFYEKTGINTAKGEHWFCTEAQARASGWRRALR